MLESIIGTEITLIAFAACMAVSLALGLGIAFLCMYKTRYTQSFVVTLAIIPAVVQMVIMLVNGNIGRRCGGGRGIQPGSFPLRAGQRTEIGMIFLAMAIGLATGMGYVVLAVLFFVVMAAFILALSTLRFGAGKRAGT